MAFELYQVRTRPIETEPGISISPSGLFHLNRAALQKWFEDSPSAQLLFDSESRQIAIKPASDKEANTLKVRRPKRAAGAHISAQGFLANIGVKFDKTQKFTLSWREDIQGAVFTLPE